MKPSNIHQVLISHNFIIDEASGVWHQVPLPEFAYNDGDDAENYILEALKQTQDVSVNSTELILKMKDWPSLYHLSSTRSNLLRPFEGWLAGKKILEIGCGCGAISRFLGESGAEVVSVEGSFRRAGIARQRCRDLSNVDIICAPSDRIPDLGQFDAVMLIGVLEYARIFLGSNGQQLLLTSCRQRMVTDGRLFVAIENKLGIKYFAGAKEDHVGLPMYGINNSYHEHGVVTFGKKEITKLLHITGFNHTEFYLPLPDYKLPVSVITPEGWQKYPSELVQLAIESAHKEQQKIVEPIFSLEQGINNIWRNDLAADLANSFLIIAGQQQQVSLTPATAAFHYSDSRLPKYRKMTVFTVSDKGEITVNAEHTEKNIDHSESFHHIEKLNQFFHGNTLWLDLVYLLNRPDWRVHEIGDWAREWVNYLLVLANKPVDYDKDILFPASFQDALPFNIIREVNGELSSFDQEWKAKEDITAGYVCFRGIFHSFLRLTSVAHTSQCSENNLARLTLAVMNDVGFTCNEQDLEIFLLQESNFLALIQERESNDVYSVLSQIGMIRRAVSMELLRLQANAASVSEQQDADSKQQTMKQAEQVATLTEEVATLTAYIETQTDKISTQMQHLFEQAGVIDSQNKNIEVLSQNIEMQTQHLQAMQNTISWKFSAPLRLLGRRLHPEIIRPIRGGIFHVHSCARILKANVGKSLRAFKSFLKPRK